MKIILLKAGSSDVQSIINIWSLDCVVAQQWGTSLQSKTKLEVMGLNPAEGCAFYSSCQSYQLCILN